MLPTVSQPIRISLVSCVWFICCASHADQIVEVARVAHASARPLHVLGQIAAARAVEPSQPALDHAPQAAHVEMPPALDAVILDRQAARPAARADWLLATQRDRHDHRLRAELHVPDPGAREPEHPVECGA